MPHRRSLPIPGLDEVDYLTSDTVWGLTELPADLVVIGGGSIGCELGQAFARLGSRVTVVEAAPRMLPREDPARQRSSPRALVEDGVELRTGSGVARIEPATPGARGASPRGRAAGGLLPPAARGRPIAAHPRLGMAAAGVEVDDRGFVVVDDLLRTSNPRIWAAGDITGHPQFTHTAGVHASLAASNAILGVRRKVDLTAMPRVTFTDPEVAAVGRRYRPDVKPPGWRDHDWSHAQVDRAVAEGETGGSPVSSSTARAHPGCHGGRASSGRDPRRADPRGHATGSPRGTSPG